MSLQGTLKTLGITEVLEFLSDRTASGRLDVTTEMGTASFGFLDGQVAESEYSFMRESGVDAAEATYYVVSELDGTFYFDDDRLPHTEENLEEVGSVLARTVDIAEKWTDVEQVIPSPNHLLIRNDELDGSVTIQPEWWKALERIGDGSTSLQLASALELGALDASLTALAMTHAGLLIVREVDPLEIELEVDDSLEGSAVTPLADVIEPAEAVEVIEPADQLVDASDFEEYVEPDVSTEADHVVEPDEPAAFSFHEVGSDPSDLKTDVPDLDSNAPHESPFQPVDMLEMVDVEAPSPYFDEPTPEPTLEAVAEPSPEPVMSFSDPVAPIDVPTQMFAAETPVVDEFAGASGMDDLSELEYVLEPDGHDGPSGTGFPGVAAVQPDVPAPLEVFGSLDDDDGWSNGHDSINDPLQPMTSMPAAAAPEPEVIHEPAPLPTPEAVAPSPFDVIDTPLDPSSIETPPDVPVPDAAGAMGFADLPEPPPPAASTMETSAIAPVPTSATAMAGEVLDDLASMTDELENRAADGENWELDGTFVPDENAPPPSVEGDPFGDLGELLNDRSDDERGSVLKFLRRD